MWVLNVIYVDAHQLSNIFCNLTVEPLALHFVNAVWPEVDSDFEIDA